MTALDFVTCMGFSQVISGPTHLREHTLDLVLCVDQRIKDLKMEEVYNISPLMDNHYLVQFRFWGIPAFCWTGKGLL